MNNSSHFIKAYPCRITYLAGGCALDDVAVRAYGTEFVGLYLKTLALASVWMNVCIYETIPGKCIFLRTLNERVGFFTLAAVSSPNCV